MRRVSPKRLSIGTVQFGLRYGVANPSDRCVPEDEVLRILKLAKSVGIDSLDTATGYQSESVLGRNGGHSFQVVTKLKTINDLSQVSREQVHQQVHQSLAALDCESLYGVLVYNKGFYAGAHRLKIMEWLEELRRSGLIRKIGCSVYDPDELDDLLSVVQPDLVQLPLNPFDRRFSHSGWLKRLSDQGIEIHVRSVFLQGLLLMRPAERPKFFSQFKGLSLWDEWHQERSRLRTCLSYVSSFADVSKIIVGILGISQLRGILDCELDAGSLPEFDGGDDEELIDPRMWKLS